MSLKSRLFRILFATLLLVLFAGYFAFSTFFFSPTESDFDADLSTLIPRQVDFYIAKADLRNAVDAIARFCDKKNLELFEQLGVLSAKEAESRMNIMFEGYSKAIAIEGQSALSIARTILLPAAQKSQRDVAESISRVKELGVEVKVQEKRLRDTTACIESFVLAIDELASVFEHAEHHSGSPLEHARTYRDKVVPAMVKLRELADALEVMTDDAYWPLPKYRELLFLQ
jgi:glutamine synthetase